ncbi:MAG: DNA primase [Patescibacteria group bacterium]
MDAVEDIKSRLDVADIVSEYLPLKPAGSGSFRACCPFHQEKTPSFYVNRPRQSWHCFGCDQGGDIISFIEKMEGMEFREALELLAQKAGVELPQFDMKKSSEKKRLYEVNDLAAKYFHAQLIQSSDAEVARAYVKKRGLDDLTTDVWRIGYAPEGWRGLSDALKAKDVTETELVNAGLALKSDRGGVYDRFRGRLMFTICDVHGNVVGFTGRILVQDSQEGKYVNTPETIAYKKSRVLYGLDKAKGEIKRQDLAVIVEGNMDVVSSHQFNINNVVASSGTALTEEQLSLIKRFSTNLAIAFDADAAGNAATVRGLDLARSLDFNIRIITLPPEAGKDPDDAVRKNPELWKQAIKDALPVVEWLYRNAFRGEDSSTPEGKKKIAAAFMPELQRIPNAVERDAWVTRLAKDLGVSDDALRDVLRATRPVGAGLAPARSAGRIGHPQGVPLPEKPAKSRKDEIVERVLAIVALKPELEPLVRKALPEYDLPDTTDELLNYLAVLADREFQDQSLAALTTELEQACRMLGELRLTHSRTDLEQQMREAERVGDTAKINELLAQFQSLNS